MNRRVNVIQGQRFVFPRNPITGFLTAELGTLVRAESPEIQSWQINLSPVFRQFVGPMTEGIPGNVFPAVDHGFPELLMTWGGGGVSWRQSIAYPVVGASFTVSGDNIQLDVRATDVLTPYAVENVPAVNAWCKPLGVPSYFTPLVISDISVGAAFGPRAIHPWCRNVVVSAVNPLATVHVVITSSAGGAAPVDVTVPGNQITRIPVPTNGYRLEVTASVGDVSVLQELAFS